MAKYRGSGKSGVVRTEFYVLSTTHVQKDGRGVPSETFFVGGKIDPDHQSLGLSSHFGIRNGREGRQMPSYRVCFMNEVPRGDKLFRCCQRSIVIPSAPSAEQAAEEAKKQFAELEGIRDWKIHAALIEVEAVDLDT